MLNGAVVWYGVITRLKAKAERLQNKSKVIVANQSILFSQSNRFDRSKSVVQLLDGYWRSPGISLLSKAVL